MKTKLLFIFSLIFSPILAQQTYNLGWSTSGESINQQLTIDVGDTVIWTWTSGWHNLVQVGDETEPGFDYPTVTGPGTIYQHTFTTPGVHDYLCGPHPSTMYGAITVNQPQSTTSNVTITKIIETGCPSPYLKTVELYVDGTVDFANDDVELNYMQNGGAWGTPTLDISSLGEVSDSFIYVVRDIALMQAEFPSTTFDSSNTAVVSTSTSGDDGYQVVLNGVIVSQFGRTGTDADNDTQSNWNHNDAVSVRLSNPDLGTWNPSDWIITPENDLDSHTFCQGGEGLEGYFDDLGGNYPLGSGSGWTPTGNECSTFLNSVSVSCETTSIGGFDDTYSASIEFSGGNNGNTFLITSSAGTVSGDSPTDLESGSITIFGVEEGTDLNVSVSDVFSGGSCDLSITIESPSCLPLIINEVHYDPASDITGDANGDGTRSALGDEFIEFYNDSSSDIDLSNFTISDALELRHTFPSPTLLPSNSMLVVFGGGTPTGSFGGSIVQTASSGQLNLSNGGDLITVHNTNGDVVVTYDSNDTGISHGLNESLTRDPDITGDFVLHTDANPDLIYSPGLFNDGSSLSLNNFDSNFFKLYPNPISGQFLNIISNSSGDIDVTIFDVLGNKVLEKSSNNNILDISSIRSGVYILKLRQNQMTATKKLIVN